MVDHKDRWRQFALLLAQGRTQAQIAAETGLTITTVNREILLGGNCGFPGLRMDGHTLQFISDSLGVSKWKLLKILENKGIEIRKFGAVQYVSKIDYSRLSTVVIKYWSVDDIARLVIAGKTAKQITAMTGLTRSATYRRIERARKLGKLPNRCGEMAAINEAATLLGRSRDTILLALVEDGIRLGKLVDNCHFNNMTFAELSFVLGIEPRPCEKCGEEFVPGRRNLHHHKKCKPMVECVNCRKVFQAKTYRSRFCSDVCANKWYWQRRKTKK